MNFGESIADCLADRAGQSADEAKQYLADRLVEEVRSAGADRLRNLEHNEGDEFQRQAKRIMGIAMQRYAGHYMRDSNVLNYCTR